jgi:hypothetical protein
MHYKGKVVSTPVAPLTSTGKTVDEATHCEYTKDTKTSDFFDEHANESDGKSHKSSY